MHYDYDLITIGAGSGGVRASRIAANHGAKTAIIEEDRPGGTCVLRGCVPKKLLVYGASFGAEAHDAVGFGWADMMNPQHDWKALMARKNAELDRLSAIYSKLLGDAGVEVIEGRGIVKNPHSVKVGGKEVTAKNILIATGGWPAFPPIEGLAEHGISSNEALMLENRPDEVVIFGAGYIAVEFAGIFNGFGAKTHLVYRKPMPLNGFDDDLREGLAAALTARGVHLHPNCTIASVKGDAHSKQITLSNDGHQCHTLTSDTLMVATGRKPLTDNLGLEAVGVATDAVGAVVVDAENRSSVASIYALGDVTNRITLTPVAIAEGHALADRLFAGGRRVMDYTNIPSAVFSQPPIATVGLTADQALKRGMETAVFTSRFRPMKNTITGRGEQALMKLVVNKADDRVVGAHMLGVDAPEIIQGIAIALKAGAKKADFDATIGIHPTTAEEFVTMR